MYYSGFGILSLAIFLIVNIRLLSVGRKNGLPTHKECYRDFLLCIIIYMITDICWGLLYERGLTLMVFLDTTVYFLVMALSVSLWAEFVVVYLNKQNLFERILAVSGKVMYVFLFLCLILNLFTPVIFSFDNNGVYRPLPIRYLFLIAQFFMFTAAAIYTYNESVSLDEKEKRHNLMIALSGTVMSVFIVLQTQNPLLPFYNIGVLIAACLIHIFVGEEEEQEKNKLLADALKKAEQASEAKSMFLSNMSHEIRTPINAIMGMNEIIRRDTDDEKIRGCADNIQKAGTSLLGIISDILDFSKIEAGKLELYNDKYWTADLMGDLYNLIRFRAEEKGLELIFDIDPNLPSQLTGDELRIKQVITNLLTNAVKYTEKGSIRMNTSCLEKEDGFAVIRVTVQDTGIGIKEEEIDKLFLEFDRLDEKRTRTIEGTGLGLPITASLLNMMGTTLLLESTYNKGSVFYFDITQEIVDDTPIGENWMDSISLARRGENMSVPAFVSPTSHILIVDDTKLNLEVICGLLESTDIAIDTAESGKQCIQLFDENDYDLVFLDYRMPKMDGIETLDKLRELYPEKASEIPVISLTASAVSGERERMLDAGFTDYITKPVILPELMKMLLKYLPEEKIQYSDTGDLPQSVSFEGIPEKLLAVSFVDVKEGIEFCGSPDLYLMGLELFVDEIDEKADQLEELFDAGDIDTFTVKVHALKSSSLTMGLSDFSAKARELELAGKANDIDMIKNDFPAFLNEYRLIKTLLRGALI